MKAARWKRIEDLYHATLKRDEGERSAFLGEACGGDAELRREVESLLARQEQAEEFLESPALEAAARGIAEERAHSFLGKQFGSYEVISLLGAGGMGEVYLAHDQSLDRKVALKFLSEELQRDVTARKRFLREARSAAALDHPFICHIHEVGEVDAIAFIAMEYVEGETLDRRLARGLLPLREALEKGIELAEALEVAHRHNIVHRDLKPSNVMLTPEGHVKVMDFGLAKRLESAGSAEGPTQTVSASLTGTGMTLGTVAYMSPEQLRGEQVDTRSDVFSFGIVLYEMLTGTHPFMKSQPIETGHMILNETPSPLSNHLNVVPSLLQHTVKRMLAKEPERRYQSVHEVRTDLEESLNEVGDSSSQAGFGVGAPTPGATTGQVSGRLRQSIPPLWLLASLAAAAIIAGLLGWHLKPGAPRSSQRLTRFDIIRPPIGTLGDYRFVLPDVAISPDGSHIVYVTGPTDNRELHVRSMDQLEARLLGSVQGVNPFFSHDGERVGFRAWRKDSLNRISILGGPAETICEVDGIQRGASWGEEDIIVFATDRSNGLLKVPAAGGEPVRLTDAREGEQHWWPDILPGGHAVLFTIMRESLGSAQVAVLSMKDVSRRVLTTGSHPRYSPTGHIVYAHGGGLWAVVFDPDRLEVRGDPVPVLESVMTTNTGMSNFSFSNTGSLVYVPGSAGEAENRLVWFDRAGTRLGEVGEAGDYSNPALSPDDGHLAVCVRNLQSGLRDIWIFDLMRGTPSRFTFETVDHTNPVWTPDGSRVLFGRKGSGIYEKAANGTGGTRRLLGFEHFIGGDMSSGDKFVFYGVEGDLWALSLDSGDLTPRPVLQEPQTQSQPELSPNGRWLAYTSNETGRSEIYVQGFPPDGSKFQISTGGGRVAKWRRDGKEMFYLEGDKLMAVEVRSEGPRFERRAPRGLFETEFGTVGRNPYVVTADGRRFLVLQRGETASSSTITVVLNWFDELERLAPTSRGSLIK